MNLAPAPNPALRLGYYAAILAAVLTLGTFVLAFLTPPLSGPGCQAGCFPYPYTDIAARFPRDYLWMYPAILVSFVFVSLQMGVQREYIFEIIAISINWTALIVSGILLAVYFRRAMRILA